MKITDIRSVRLWRPRGHGVGGGTPNIAKVVICLDTEAGIHGPGRVDAFLVVRLAIIMRNYFLGRDAFAANATVSEMLSGTRAPNPAGAPRELRANKMIKTLLRIVPA